MAVQARIVEVQSQVGVTAHSSFLCHDPASTRLMVMLPGRGYTCDYPVLYYVRRMASKHGFDVLSVEYGFQAAHTDLDAQNTAYLLDDVSQAVGQVLQPGYTRVCIVGKSLGTALAVDLSQSIGIDDVSLILLTPVGGALQTITIPTLAVMGSDDPLYSREFAESFKNDPNVEWQVFNGLNHSLEVRGDWKASIAALDDVIAVCEEFLMR